MNAIKLKEARKKLLMIGEKNIHLYIDLFIAFQIEIS